MNLQTSRQQISGEAKKLNSAWKALEGHWTDNKASEFKKQYIEKLEREINSSLKAIEGINEIFKLIQEDCFKDD
jgi:hypothetical protein